MQLVFAHGSKALTSIVFNAILYLFYYAAIKAKRKHGPAGFSTISVQFRAKLAQKVPLGSDGIKYIRFYLRYDVIIGVAGKGLAFANPVNVDEERQRLWSTRYTCGTGVNPTAIVQFPRLVRTSHDTCANPVARAHIPRRVRNFNGMCANPSTRAPAQGRPSLAITG